MTDTNPRGALSIGRGADNGNPGFDTPGVNILIESEGLGGHFGNLSRMTADDYAGGQFLYPFVPEPAAMGVLALSAFTVAVRRRR